MSPDRVDSRDQTANYGVFYGEPILPPSLKQTPSAYELERNYPLRYQIWSIANGQGLIQKIPAPEVLTKRLTVLNRLDGYIMQHQLHGRARVLRDRQLAVFIDTRDFLEKGHFEGFIEAPTGFGKTILFSEIIRATDQTTLIVVPSILLVEQTYEKLKELMPDLDLGRMYSDVKEPGRKVTITTYNSLVLSNGGVNPKNIDLLVLDEVHQSLTNVRINAVGQFENAIKIGFTATPEYTKDKRVENLLNNEVHIITLREAVEAGYLCSFSAYLAETNVDISNVSIDPNGDFNTKELEEAVNVYSRNKSAADLYIQLVEKDSELEKAVVYCTSVKHAKDVAKTFSDTGISAEAIYSGQDKNERMRLLREYKEGQIKILTNVNVLTEGFDDPEAALCINLRPTLSRVVAKQRGGRVLRLDPNNPLKHAVVVDYLDRNEGKRYLQITFAQVAEGAQIINPFASIKPQLPLVESIDPTSSQIAHQDSHGFDLEGLNVVTDAEEVLRVINKMEAEIQNLQEIKPSEFAITYPSLASTFIGSKEDLKKIADEILDNLTESDPDLVVRRALRNNAIFAVTDKERFIDEMITRDRKLRVPWDDDFHLKDNLQGAKSSDFVVSTPSLRETFIGKSRKGLRLFAESIIEEFKAVDQGLVAKRNVRGNVVTVATDRQRFIDSMLSRGVMLRDKPLERSPSAGSSVDTSIRRVKPADFLLSIGNLRSTFIGGEVKLRHLSKSALGNLMEIDPSLIVQIKVSGQIVTACTDRQIFIDAMVKTGAVLREDKNQRRQNSSTDYFRVTRRALKEVFLGDPDRLFPIANSVISLLRDEDPEIISNSVSGSTIVPTVVDKQRFIKGMLMNGVKLRSLDEEEAKAALSDIQASDFVISVKSLRTIFIGSSEKLKSLSELAIEKLGADDPNILAKRKTHGLVVTVVVQRDKFIDTMTQLGALLRDLS